jgi:hypothetical protein
MKMGRDGKKLGRRWREIPRNGEEDGERYQETGRKMERDTKKRGGRWREVPRN